MSDTDDQAPVPAAAEPVNGSPKPKTAAELRLMEIAAGILIERRP
jgi:hypothetical protein